VVGDALPGDALRDGAALAGALRPLAAALPHLPFVTLDDDEAAAVRHGRAPRRRTVDALGVAAPLAALRDRAGELVAVLRLPPGGAGAARLAAVFEASRGEGARSCG
jgi:hypothetical protein